MSNNHIEYHREFSKESFGEMVDSLNTVLNSLLLAQMSGQILENILLPVSGGEVAIAHNLKSVPKYRIILRQAGSGIIVDGDTPWDDKKIYLKLQQSTSDVTLSVLILRG